MASHGTASTPAAPREALDLDRLIHERMRLGIVSALAVNDRLSFNDLKQLLKTTDGNLTVHARKLEEAGYVACEKYFDGRVPKTEYRLTRRPARARALPRPHGSDHPRHPGGLSGRRFALANFAEKSSLQRTRSMRSRAPRRDHHGRQRALGARARPARTAGHEAGAGAVRRTVEAAPDLGIGMLTLFAFSSDNWKRPPEEVGSLMRLLPPLPRARGRALRRERRADRGDRPARPAARAASCGRSRPPRRRPRGAGRFLLRLAVDYSARDAILAPPPAAGNGHGAASREAFARLLAEAARTAAARSPTSTS